METKKLVAGYRSGDLTDALLAKEPAVHVFDIYHAHAIEKAWRGRARVVCSAHVPEGPFDEAWLKTGPRLMPAELQLDLLQEIFLALADGAILHVEYEGAEADALSLLGKVFEKSVKRLESNRRAVFLDCRKRGELKRVREFAAKWTASVPGLAPVEFVSSPGCCCHRRVEPGGLALAETASRELVDGTACAAPRGGRIRILDMGCGCGMVGLLVARRLMAEGREVALSMIDSHSRAVEAANLNAAALGVEAETILSDNGIPRDAGHLGAFDVFVGNPPYYSDYRIADVFLETAYAALAPGGVCYSVVKTASGLAPVQEKYFRRLSVIRRRDYSVLKSVR